MSRPFGPGASWTSLALLSVLTGCSEFNMAPPCSEIGDSVTIALIPNALVGPDGRIDQARVLDLASLTDLTEVGHGYNERTCRGALTFKPKAERISVTFRVEQAEGVRRWQKVTFLDAGQPSFDTLVSDLRAAYAQARP
jgi:hypothetical protein